MRVTKSTVNYYYDHYKEGDFPYLVGYKYNNENFEVLKGFKEVHLAWKYYFELFSSVGDKRHLLRVRRVKEQIDEGFRYFTESIN